jgi:hypothetical protein
MIFLWSITNDRRGWADTITVLVLVLEIQRVISKVARDVVYVKLLDPVSHIHVLLNASPTLQCHHL